MLKGNSLSEVDGEIYNYMRILEEKKEDTPRGIVFVLENLGYVQGQKIRVHEDPKNRCQLTETAEPAWTQKGMNTYLTLRDVALNHFESYMELSDRKQKCFDIVNPSAYNFLRGSGDLKIEKIIVSSPSRLFKKLAGEEIDGPIKTKVELSYITQEGISHYYKLEKSKKIKECFSSWRNYRNVTR